MSSLALGSEHESDSYLYGEAPLGLRGIRTRRLGIVWSIKLAFYGPGRSALGLPAYKATGHWKLGRGHRHPDYAGGLKDLDLS